MSEIRGRETEVRSVISRNLRDEWRLSQFDESVAPLVEPLQNFSQHFRSQVALGSVTAVALV